MDFFTSPYFKPIWRNFMWKLTPIVAKKTTSFFKESCVFTLKGDYMKSKSKAKDLESNITNDKFQALVFCFLETSDRMTFIKEFTKSYSAFIKTSSNLFDIQKFSNIDNRNVKYYTSDQDYFDDEENDSNSINAWVAVNDEGILFNGLNVI